MMNILTIDLTAESHIHLCVENVSMPKVVNGFGYCWGVIGIDDQQGIEPFQIMDPCVEKFLIISPAPERLFASLD